LNLFDDTVWIGCPNKGFGFPVVLAEIAIDRGLQVDERAEDAAVNAAGSVWQKKLSTALARSTKSG
jgi:hypothetical protein